MWVWSLAGIAMSCGVGCTCGSDPVLLWLQCRSAAAALIGPLDWELPYAVGVALKKKKQQDVVIVLYMFVVGLFVLFYLFFGLP